MKNKILFSLILLILFGFNLYGQLGALKGKVFTDDGIIPGVNVILLQTLLGSVTDINGNYEITNIPVGKYKVRFGLVGYKNFVTDISIVANTVTNLNCDKLERDVILMKDVEIIGKKSRDVTDPQTSVIDLSPEKVKIMAGGGEDVLRTLQSLPGVLAPNDFSSQLVVRGSGPDQNLIVIDDIEIFNPYRLYGVISMFNPDAVSDITLLTGGFPATYGDRLSAVLDVTNREGTINRNISGSLNASVTNANLVLEGKNPLGVKGSWLVNSRRTYYDLIIAPFAKSAGLVDDNTAFPNFYDIQTKLTFGPFSGHKIILSGIYSADGVDVVSGKERKTPDSVSINNVTLNNVAGVTWQYAPSNKLLNRFTVSYYKNSGITGFSSEILDPTVNRTQFNNGTIPDTLAPYLLNFQFDNEFSFAKISVDDKLNIYWGKNLFEIGGGLDYIENTVDFKFRLDPQLRAIFQNNPNFRSALENIRDVSGYYRYKTYIQNTLAIGDNLYINTGLRFDSYDVLKKSYFAPRLSISYGLDVLTIFRFAWGVYYQSPGYEKLRDQNILYDLKEKSTKDLQAEKAVHYVLGIERWLTNEWNIRAEIYYKDFTDLIAPKVVKGSKYYTELIPGREIRSLASWTRPVPVFGNSLTQLPVNSAYGESYGLEILLAKKNKEIGTKLSGWVAYALAFADQFENGVKTPFRFDQRHTLNIVLDYQFNTVWSIGGRWELGTGFPATEPNGIKPRIIMVDANGDGKPETPAIAVRTSATNSGYSSVVFDLAYADKSKFNSRKPTYHRLDIRVTAATKIWGYDCNFYLDVINVYNHSNVLQYQYFVNDDLSVGRQQTNMFPILPTIGLSLRF